MTNTDTTLFGCLPGVSGDNVVIGIPYDKTSGAHTGCSKAPVLLRSLTRGFGIKQGFAWNQQNRTKAFVQLSISDAGNIVYPIHETQASYFERCVKTVEHLAKAKKRILVLGGDHVISLPVLRGLATVYKEFQVIQLDAHTDYHRRLDNDQPTHANFVAFAAELPQIKKWFQAGVRTYSRECPDFPEKVISCDLASAIDQLDPSIPVYITIDTDGFDPSLFPGVGHPVPQGLTFADLDFLLVQLQEKGVEVIGADWVEYNPDLDLKNYLTGQSVIAALIKILNFFEKKGPLL